MIISNRFRKILNFFNSDPNTEFTSKKQIVQKTYKQNTFPDGTDLDKLHHAMLDFVGFWYDIDTDNITSDPEDEPTPPTLQFMYDIPEINSIYCQNHLLRQQREKKDKLTNFYSENQNVCEWYYDEDPIRPNVYVTDWETGSDKLLKEGEKLPIFLYQSLIFETIKCGSQPAANAWSVSKEEINTAIKGWKKIPYKAWRWPGGHNQFYYQKNSLAMVNKNNSEFDFTCISKSPEVITKIHSGAKSEDWNFRFE